MGLFDRIADALSGRPSDWRGPNEGQRDYTTDATPGAVCNDRTDFPPYKQTNLARRCVGTCTPDRQPMTHAGQALAALNAVGGMIDWQQLGKPRNDDEAAEWEIQRRMAETDRMPSPAVYYANLLQNSDDISAEQARLLNGCTSEEQAIYLTYQEARLAGMSDTAALAPMGLQRGAGNKVERREPQPVRLIR